MARKYHDYYYLQFDDYISIRNIFNHQKHILIWDIAWYTGRPWSHIVKLKINHVYNDDGSVKDEIIFPNTNAIVHPKLRAILEAYIPDRSQDWLLRGTTKDGHFGYNAAILAFNRAARKIGLETATPNVTRDRFIYRLFSLGVNDDIIMKLVGFKSRSSLADYKARIQPDLSLIFDAI